MRVGEPADPNYSLCASGVSPFGRNEFVTTTFQYDNGGNVVQKTTDGTTSTYVYDHANRLTALGVFAATTTYGYHAFGDEVRQATGSAAPYGTAPTVQWLDYAPYGNVIASENTGTTTAARQYIGQFSDASGLSYLNARYYNSNQGQFISEDPTFLSIGNPTQLQQLSQQDQKTLLQNPQQLNSYSYSQDNPIVDKDPSGLLALQIGGEYTVPLWGLSGEGGIYIDQNGIDYYYGAGLGAIGGADATIGVTTADLSHTYSVSAAGFVAGGDVVGAELEKGEIYYPYSLRKPQSYQEASVGLSEELTGGVMSQVSGPLIVWNQPQSSANYSLPYPQMI
jgi:RHS repeat-associated protein